jgi:hypothetical protein
LDTAFVGEAVERPLKSPAPGLVGRRPTEQFGDDHLDDYAYAIDRGQPQAAAMMNGILASGRG